MSAAAPKIPKKTLPAFAAKFHRCGRVDLDDCLLLQQRLAYDALTRRDGRLTLILCEHPPQLTIGRAGSRRQASISAAELVARNAAVRFIPRGEGALWHAPGQLAAYLICDLNWRKWTPGDYLRRLHQAAAETLRDLGVSQTTNLWGRTGKLGAAAVAVRAGVASYGLFLNIHCDPAEQARITPLQAPPLNRGPPQYSTIVQELAAAKVKPSLAPSAAKVTMQLAQERLLARLSENLGCHQPVIEFGHPLLPEAGETIRRGAA